MRRTRNLKRLMIAAASLAAMGAAAYAQETPTPVGSVYPGDVVAPVSKGAPPKGRVAAAPRPVADASGKLARALGPAGYLISEVQTNAEFEVAIMRAVARHPAYHAEAADLDESGANRKRARSALYPKLSSHLGVDYSLTRQFAAGTDNVVESLRPREQVTASISASQLIFDGGATIQRLRSARAQDLETQSSFDARVNELTLNALSAYQDVAAHQALLAFSEGFIQRQQKILADVKERERLGAGSKADVTRALARLAAARARYSEVSESKRIAEVRYEEFFGAPPPALLRPAMAGVDAESRDESVSAALENNPQIAAAAARADARQAEFKAARAARLPSVSVTMDAFKYDILEGGDDFDVRAGLAVHYDIFGGGSRAADIAIARSRAKRGRFEEEQVRKDVAREAAIAFERVDGAGEKLDALADALIAHDETRDLVLERYKLSRGDLIDVLQAENDYFEAGVAYVIALSARDMAAYALMEQTGALSRMFSPEIAYQREVFGVTHE